MIQKFKTLQQPEILLEPWLTITQANTILK